MIQVHSPPIDDDIEVVAAPVYLNGTRWVTVTWKNVPNPSNDDWIGLWVLWNSTEIDPKAAAPVKYQVSKLPLCFTSMS